MLSSAAAQFIIAVYGTCLCSGAAAYFHFRHARMKAYTRVPRDVAAHFIIAIHFACLALYHRHTFRMLSGAAAHFYYRHK